MATEQAAEELGRALKWALDQLIPPFFQNLATKGCPYCGAPPIPQEETTGLDTLIQHDPDCEFWSARFLVRDLYGR